MLKHSNKIKSMTYFYVQYIALELLSQIKKNLYVPVIVLNFLENFLRFWAALSQNILKSL